MNKQYNYDYPEQREVSKGLVKGDWTLVAKKTGYSLPSISGMCKGRRKMPDTVRDIVKKVIEVRKRLEEEILNQ